MRLRLRVDDEGGFDDVVVDADPAATAADLAAALGRHGAPRGRSADPTCGDRDSVGDHDAGLHVVDVAGRAWTVPPATPLGVAGLRSGVTVQRTSTGLGEADPEPIATLTVHTGPDAPAHVALGAGWHVVGRGPECDVRLSDQLVSSRHARLFIGDHVRIVDHGSSNGVQVGGERVSSVVLAPSSRCLLGSTTLSVRTLPTVSGSVVDGEVPFNRSPRVEAHFDGLHLTAPEPPRVPAPVRFPIATVLAPVVLAAVLFAITQSVLSVLFFALSPILMLGTWWETRSANRRQLAADTARFRTALDELRAQLQYAHQLEELQRCREYPSGVDVLEAVGELSPLVWTRRPEHERFGCVRVGLAPQASRTTVELPPAGDAMPGLRRELIRTVETAAMVDDVPVVANLRAVGNLGIAAPDDEIDALMRGVLVQLIGLHAPSELRLAAFAPTDRWDWLKWTPHTEPPWLAATRPQSDALVTELHTIVTQRAARPADAVALPIVVVAVADDAPADRSALVRLAEQGPDVGVHVVWAAATIERLPAACRVFVEAASAPRLGTVGIVDEHLTIETVRLEPVGVAAAERVSRTLSPLVDQSRSGSTSTMLASDVPLADLLGGDVARRPDSIVERWGRTGLSDGQHRGDTGRSAVVGLSRNGPLSLDLRRHGPHAIVGGTTGAGKSEFLQSWILSLAADHAPSHISFLLVDYKGGAAFAECVDLPHCVGLVTDLRPQLVRRALTSLEAELRRRERLLHDRRAKDLQELEARRDPSTPPSLVIVIDEFAALAADVPEFVDGVVDLAQRGRSLGLHLVLATQRPAGVVTDNLRANANLRIALRMADGSDSTDVVGTPAAADLDPSVPGRAIAVLGTGEQVEFQCAYVGGRTVGHDRRSPITVSSLRFGELTSAARRATSQPVRGGPTDMVRLVSAIRAAASLHSCVAPRRPWLPDLADCYRLEALPTSRTDDALVFGVADDPAQQAQPPAVFRPDVDGNMAVYGTGGAGKSTALRSIAVAAGVGTVRGGNVWVYAIDGASGGLRPLEQLPHVGAVVGLDDDERILRLLSMIAGLLDDRAVRYASVGASTIGEYRDRAGADDARVLLLIDGFGAFREAYEGGRRHDRWERFARLASDGRSVGVHVVVAADRPAAIPASLAASVQRELRLRLARDLDAGVLDQTVRIDSDAPAGRGVFSGLETQVAVLGGAPGAESQLGAIGRFAAGLSAFGVAAPPPVGALPNRVTIRELEPITGQVVIGISDETLRPFGVELDGGFLIAGEPGSGVTSAVSTVVQAIDRSRTRSEFVLLGEPRSPLADLDVWLAMATGSGEVAVLAEQLRIGALASVGRSLVIVVEAIDALLDTAAEAPVHELMRGARDRGALVVASGDTTRLSGSWPLLRAARTYRSGLVLQPDHLDGETLFHVPFPLLDRRDFPVGRGLVVDGGVVTKVQVALPE